MKKLLLLLLLLNCYQTEEYCDIKQILKDSGHKGETRYYFRCDANEIVRVSMKDYYKYKVTEKVIVEDVDKKENNVVLIFFAIILSIPLILIVWVLVIDLWVLGE